MKRPRLYLSFWNICLEHLPGGKFRHRLIAPGQAKRAVQKAQREKSLLCVTQDDLLAPYCKRQRRDHAALCKVLADEFDIKLTLAGFVGELKDDDGPLNVINPLVFARVQKRDRLIVVTCMFEMRKRKSRDPLAFDVSASSIEFHLFEAV